MNMRALRWIRRSNSALLFAVGFMWCLLVGSHARAASFTDAKSDADFAPIDWTFLHFSRSLGSYPYTSEGVYKTVTGPFGTAPHGSPFTFPFDVNAQTASGAPANSDDRQTYGNTEPLPGTESPVSSADPFIVGELRAPQFANDGGSLDYRSGSAHSIFLFNQAFYLPANGSYFTRAEVQADVRALYIDPNQGNDGFSVAAIAGVIDPVYGLRLYQQGLINNTAASPYGAGPGRGSTKRPDLYNWLRFDTGGLQPWTFFQGQPQFGTSGNAPNTLPVVFGLAVASNLTQEEAGFSNSNDRHALFAIDNFSVRVEGEGGDFEIGTFALAVPEADSIGLMLLAFVAVAISARSLRAPR